MGLAGPRKRRKIGHDPNNTNWSRSDSGYGHKILSAQGWTEGSYLGAKDAAQSSHFSHANASHIRVLLKEDNLGLGAKGGNTEDTNFALASLQDLYGRLNGKSDARLQEEQRYRSNVKRTLYADRKWGVLRFVPGGVLVGDSIVANRPKSPLSAADKPTLANVSASREALETAMETETSSHDQSRARASEDGPSRDANGHGDPSSKGKWAQKGGKIDKTGKKKKRRNKENALGGDSRDTTASFSKGPTDEDAHAHSHESDKRSRRDPEINLGCKVKRKSRQRQHKLDKTTAAVDLKDDKARPKDVSELSSSSDSLQCPQSDGNDQRAQQLAQNGDVRASSRPVHSRLAVRQRFIKQKRMSSMDPQALQEILMLKS